MKKLIYYLIFLLALVMMLLACSACRSQKAVTCSQAMTDSVKVRVRDSSARRFEFTFDSLELWSEFRNLENKVIDSSLSKKESGNSQAQPLPKFLGSSVPKFHHAVVYGGKLTANITRAMSQDSTSNKTTKETKTTRIRPDPLPIIIITGIFALIYVLYRYTKKP